MMDTPLMSAQPPHECQPIKPAPTSAREPTRASSRTSAEASSGASAGASAGASYRTSARASSGASAGTSSRTSAGASSRTSTGESTKHGRDVIQQPSHKQATLGMVLSQSICGVVLYDIRYKLYSNYTCAHIYRQRC